MTLSEEKSIHAGAVLPYLLDAPGESREVERVAVHDDEVRDLARDERSQPVVQAHQFRRARA